MTAASGVDVCSYVLTVNDLAQVAWDIHVEYID